MDESTAPYPPDSPEARVSDATTYFGLELMRVIASKANASETAKTIASTTLGRQQPQQDTTVVSPLSMQILLNTLLLGAADHSLSQAKLAKVLGYGDETKCRGEEENPESTSARLAWAHEAMHNLVDSIMKASRLPSEHELEPDTSRLSFTLKNLVLFNNDILHANQEYLSALDRYYSDTICVKQFSWREPLRSSSTGEPVNLPEYVSMWIKEVTNNRIIGGLADESSLSKSALRFALVSATQLRAHWLYAFDPNLTQDGEFWITDQYWPRIKVKFMRQTGLFGYNDMTYGQTDCSTRPDDPPCKSRVDVMGKLDCQVLSLPLSAAGGQELSMVILMPHVPGEFKHIIENLTVRGLNQIYRHLHLQWVDVLLPKFTIEASHNVKPILSEPGLLHAFSDEAGLDPMLVPKEEYTGIHVKVDGIIQVARVEVDELGAGVADAPTAPVDQATNVDPEKEIPRIRMTVCYPFLFIIRHNRSNMPLFIGQVTNFPQADLVNYKKC